MKFKFMFGFVDELSWESNPSIVPLKQPGDPLGDRGPGLRTTDLREEDYLICLVHWPQNQKLDK